MCTYHSLYKHWVYKQNTCDNIDFKARLIFYSTKMNDAVKERQIYVRHVEKNECCVKKEKGQALSVSMGRFLPCRRTFQASA